MGAIFAPRGPARDREVARAGKTSLASPERTGLLMARAKPRTRSPVILGGMETGAAKPSFPRPGGGYGPATRTERRAAVVTPR